MLRWWITLLLIAPIFHQWSHFRKLHGLRIHCTKKSRNGY
ncbi:unnamed protein product [Angiostrongylus costaricensis]|uniref:Secreted protein n=1 Tax=Angiostrongylus costaricensis TaxID=334426 RepID=A0A0R3PIH0_ANGCS|nr:unnamed protein product [Angiostrongylus costaricensis]